MSKRSEFAAPATITRGQAPAGTEVGPGATKYVDHQPPAPPAPPAADVAPIQKARNQKLAQIATDTIPSNSISASSTAEAHGDSVTRKTYRRDGTVVETTSSWRCLPDGTDPRGPKGK